IRYYDGPGWGFSSRNFYAEFLAALEIDKNADTYFGRWPKETLPPTRTVMLDRPVDIFSAAQIARIDRNGLADLNPALMEPVVSGPPPIPGGQGPCGPRRRSRRLHLPARPGRAGGRSRRRGTPARSTGRFGTPCRPPLHHAPGEGRSDAHWHRRAVRHQRSEERRVGKEWRARWSPDH